MNTDKLLIEAAQRYEAEAFLTGDPSFAMHAVQGSNNQEVIAFIAASLSYGSRAQFLPKIQTIIDNSAGQPRDWVACGLFHSHIPPSSHSFYRLYSYKDMNGMLERLAIMLRDYGTIGHFVRQESKDATSALSAIEALTTYFRPSKIIPKDTNSACKRLCMFLRWMVREGSPVDLGLWTFIDPRTLIIPLDTHVLSVSRELGLTQSKSATMTAALHLTARLAEVFPDDPLKGDYALFGMGVNKDLP